MWEPGDRLKHRFNPDLGPGRVVTATRRQVLVQFPRTGEVLGFAADTGALAPLELRAGSRVRVEATGETVAVEKVLGDGSLRLADGRELAADEVWPLTEDVSPIDLLARGEVGAWEDFANRLDGLRLQRLRRADGLGSFLGGRIRLFPHQLYVAERACRQPAQPPETQTRDTDGKAAPVRWLLADEVGLGKTVEACLIMNRLIHTGRAESTLVVAPDALTVQWLGELWRKHHQVFVLLDEKRLADVEREYGKGFNPFEVYRRAIIGLDELVARRRLTEQAVEAGIDLLVVDEAHHLRRRPRHPGNAAYRAVEPIAALGRSVLLLTATPLEDDAHGFFRLLQLLRPEELPEDSFEERLARRLPLPACASATRRVDVGGLPPRLPAPADVADAADGWALLARLEQAERARSSAGLAAPWRKADRVFRALASPAALLPLIEGSDTNRVDADTAALAEQARDADPRVAWLIDAARRWAEERQKSLIFVAHRESLDHLKAALEGRGLPRVAIFHEELSVKRRDIEVAQFRLADGPSLLITTECGGEGRNFEFCHRLVLFDLPWNPAVVEQRIGRLDRIGRTLPTEVVYFRPPGGLGRAIVRLYEKIGLFKEPLGGLERELRHVAHEVERVALGDAEEIDPATFDAVLDEAREANLRVREAAYHELLREPYRAEMTPGILDRVPPELEELNEDVVLRAAARFGFEVDEQGAARPIEDGRSQRAWLIEHGAQALVDHLPGVPEGSRYLGTFDRATGVERETIDFFASGHPLVEGILAELEEGPRGRVALAQVAGDQDAFVLLALYQRGADFEVVAIDARGRRRDDLAALLTAPGLEREHADVRKWTSQRTWERGIRKMAAALPRGETPQAVAAVRVRRTRS
ncbi:MAG: DEAD/DEAH box helicase family protein [bacterium]|nr:DEAD/DEAH box helicase family protein [bacterium]